MLDLDCSLPAYTCLSTTHLAAGVAEVVSMGLASVVRLARDAIEDGRFEQASRLLCAATEEGGSEVAAAEGEAWIMRGFALLSLGAGACRRPVVLVGQWLSGGPFGAAHITTVCMICDACW